MRHIILIYFLIFYTQLNAQSDTLIVIQEHTILFDSDEFDIRKDQTTILDSFITRIKRINFDQIKIEGHTDQIGHSDYNQELSKKRALAVIDYLALNDIHNQGLDYKFFGEKLLLSDSKDDQTHQQNRRVKISVLKYIKRQWLKGLIVDDRLEQGIQSKVIVHSKFWEETIQTNSDGKFQALVPKGNIIGFDVIADGFLLDMSMIKVKPQMANTPIKLKLKEISEGRRFDMKRLYFVGDQDFLLPRSYEVLPRLFDFMKVNDSTCIEIRGHINLPNIGKTTIGSHYQDLSISRARRIYKYLQSKGINESRMIYKGYGNWEMVHPNAKLESEMVKNRRVEAIIISCDKTQNAHHDELLETSAFYRFKAQDYGTIKY